MKVTRNRVVKPSARRSRRTVPVGVIAGGLALAVSGGVAYSSTDAFRDHQVGTEYADGLQVSSNQVIQPLGDRLSTPYGKFMGATVSPDGRYLAATSADRSVSLQVFDLKTYRLIWRGGTAAGVNARLSDNTVGQEGPLYSPDGQTLYMPNATGITRFPVNPDGTLGSGTRIDLPTVDGHRALTGGMAFSADGSTLYAALNGQNSVVAIDPTAGTVTHTWPVGIAPRQVQLVGDKLYVSDEGGRRARPGEPTLDSYGTAVPADPVKGTSNTGVLSVIDTAQPTAAVGQIDVGLHPTALHADGNAIYVANTNSDTVSVVDTGTDKVVQTIATQPYRGSAVGYAPDAVTVQGDHLLVSLGRANAVAVYRLGTTPLDPVSYVGLLPTDYYPEDVFPVGDQLVVSNRRGIDARGPAVTVTYPSGGTPPATGHGTHSTTASLTRFTLPSDADIQETWTPRVFAQNGWSRGLHDVQHAPAGGTSTRPVPVPKRIGDPSTI